eukprot:COSAG01_NODE_4511_length_4964_cov_8.275437_3_plen_75_part_00
MLQVKLLHDFGFDGVKIGAHPTIITGHGLSDDRRMVPAGADGCGAQRNNTLYAELMRESGKNYVHNPASNPVVP